MQEIHTQANNYIRPSKAEMKLANVHPDTGLATDYLNLFNEYIMLCEMVIDGSIDKETLNEWQAIDYESHFILTGFTGRKTVIAAYQTLDKNIKQQFEDEVNELIALISKHKKSPNMPLCEIKHQRDIVASIITGAPPAPDDDIDHTQADIDALFD